MPREDKAKLNIMLEDLLRNLTKDPLFCEQEDSIEIDVFVQTLK